jgi:hypothetical protein
MWKQLRRVLARFWRWSLKGHGERRSAAARTRFWAEVREGEREAEARLRP